MSSIIENLASFNPNNQFLTTSLTVEDKVKGWVFKYSLLQTIKGALGRYDTATIGQKLTALIGLKSSDLMKNLTETEKHFYKTGVWYNPCAWKDKAITDVVRNILNLNNKIISKQSKDKSRFHAHFAGFFREAQLNSPSAKSLLLGEIAPLRSSKATPERLEVVAERLHAESDLEHEKRKAKRIEARKKATTSKATPGRSNTTLDECTAWQPHKNKVRDARKKAEPVVSYPKEQQQTAEVDEEQTDTMWVEKRLREVFQARNFLPEEIEKCIAEHFAKEDAVIADFHEQEKRTTGFWSFFR